MKAIVAELVIALISSACISSYAATVQYEVIFDSTWSQATHPNAWVGTAHYSGLIGGTHNANVKFWELGGLSTQGIQDMAEKGAQATLAGEVNAAIATGNALSLIQGIATGLRPSPGQDRTTFQIDTAHPLVTLVTMVAPSPDWFVGVNGLELYQNNQWRNNVVVELLPYDAGTDSGVTFNSANLVTAPHEPIAYLGAPFTGSPPMGIFTFRILPGAGDVNVDGLVNIFDVNLVSQNWSSAGPHGDANGDGIVNIFDINLISANWTVSGAVATPVPEPSAVALVISAAALLIMRRRGLFCWPTFDSSTKADITNAAASRAVDAARSAPS